MLTAIAPAAAANAAIGSAAEASPVFGEAVLVVDEELLFDELELAEELLA